MKTKEINNLLKKYKSYIYKIAGNYAKDKTLLEDLTQECFIGFIRAVKNFDVTRGIQFKTYALHWMKGYVLKYLKGKTNTIKIPGHLSKYLKEYETIKNKLSIKLGREPTDEEIVTESELLNEYYVNKVNEIENLIPLSLDYSYKEDEKPLIDIISETSIYNKSMDVNLIHEHIQKCICKLSPKQAEVIRLRFGFNKEGKYYKYIEIGRLFGCSSENIRQIEKHALNNLRNILKDMR